MTGTTRTESQGEEQDEEKRVENDRVSRRAEYQQRGVARGKNGGEQVTRVCVSPTLAFHLRPVSVTMAESRLIGVGGLREREKGKTNNKQ